MLPLIRPYRKPIAVILMGIVFWIVGAFLCLISIITGAYYSNCIASDKGNCGGFTSPLILAGVGVLLILIGISSLIGGVRYYVVMRKMFRSMTKEAATSHVPYEKSPQLKTLTSTTTTTVMPQPQYSGNVVDQPMINTLYPYGQPYVVMNNNIGYPQQNIYNNTGYTVQQPFVLNNKGVVEQPYPITNPPLSNDQYSSYPVPQGYMGDVKTDAPPPYSSAYENAAQPYNYKV